MHLFNFNHQGTLAIPSFDTGENEQQNIFKTGDRQLEKLISNLLRYGVLIAFSTVLVGGVLYLFRYGVEPVDYHFFQGQPSVFDSPKLVVRGILSGSHNSIIIFGFLLLIAIPVIRVALSLFTFVRQRDFTYTVMTMLALLGLIYSFIGAYA